MTEGLGLGEVYGGMIDRIMAQGGDKSQLAIEALMWISHAERPLRANELCHALAIQAGSMDFYAGNTPSINTLVACCQGLITVDNEASNVRLIHYTLKEYLSAHPDIFSTPHCTMAEVCLTYLNSRQVKAIPLDDDPDLNAMPFLEYGSKYWGAHARRELSTQLISLALQLLQEYDGHISTQLLFGSGEYWQLDEVATWYPFSGLHCASFFGIVDIVAALTKIGCCDTNGEDLLGHTPLVWASKKGHEEVVKMLLGREEVNPDKPDRWGRTPLSYAAEYGYGEVVKMLLGRKEVNPNKPDDEDETPLNHAALSGKGEVVKMLLERGDVNPDQPGCWDRTALSCAAWQGHESVVRILLGHEEVNLDKPDYWGRTPLSCAAGDGKGEVVKMLLGRKEVNPDKPDNEGRTPLSYAAGSGYGEVVKILLGRKEVNPDKPDNNGRTPLSEAAAEGKGEVVKMLLERQEVNFDKPHYRGRTPLSYAAEYGNGEAVKTLLGREEVNPDKPDYGGRTPLSYAAGNGYGEVVKMLLGREGVVEFHRRSLRTHVYFVVIPFLSFLLLSISSFVSHYQSRRRGEYTWFVY